MSGRSRGRARTSTAPQAGGAAATPSGAPPPSSSAVPVAAPPARLASPQRAPVQPADTGRGRGLTTADLTTPAPSMIGTETTSTSGGNGNGNGTTTIVSPSGAPSESSPPQQHSPPHPSTSMGRAALRGGPHQPGLSSRTEVIGPMERLALQDPGDVRGPQAAAARREMRIESVLYTRPATCTDKKGTAGTALKIICNYFEVLSSPDWVLYQYHVDYLPVIDSKRMRIALLRNHDALFPANKAFDGSTIYSLTKLPDEVTEVASRRETDNEIITIKIKRVGEIVPTSPNFVHLFNLVFRRCLKLYGMKQIDRNFYDMTRRIPIPEYGLDLINGFSTSVASYENKLLLCAELTHKLLHKTTVHDLMSDYYNQARGNDQRFREQCEASLIGRIVMTRYNDKTYAINDINWDAKPTATFEKNGQNVSFIQYYKDQYQIEIGDHQQPLITILPSARDKRRGQTKPMMLVPELCILTGVDERMREDFRFKKAVEAFTKFGPRDRSVKLSNFVSTFTNDQKVKDELAKWKMRFSTMPAEIVGRALPPDSLMFGNGVVKQLNEKADWSNDLKNVLLLSSVPLDNWVIVFPQSKRSTANSFITTYSQVIRSMGIDANRPQEIQMPHDNPDNYVNALKGCINERVQMVVAIIASKRKDRYDAIKRICCLERPVPSQVVTSQIVDDERKRRSVVTKIAIQMNCKLGGELWASNIPLKDVMICGIDTYHDSQKKKSSVCAFIATSNDTKTKFFSRATIQETHQELSNNLTITVKSACDHYFRQNKKYPEKLIIYRDGVSDGQLSLVLDYEIPQIQKAFEIIEPNYKPTLAFIVVKKRGNARFFELNRDVTNPPCGTIIDTVVTRAEWFDFYLISQYVTQGTVNPTHYNVVYDTIGLKPDHFQRLSFKLTHMYYNWPGTIRVPALCQYAHKLAFLVGQSLHKEHHSSLCDKLFYL